MNKKKQPTELVIKLNTALVSVVLLTVIALLVQSVFIVYGPLWVTIAAVGLLDIGLVALTRDSGS